MHYYFGTMIETIYSGKRSVFPTKMKKFGTGFASIQTGMILKHFILLLFFLTGTMFAQTRDELFVKIESAIKNGDAIALSEMFDRTVEITIAETDKEYAKNQAMYVVKEFFVNYPIRSFNIVHKGNSGDTYYAVGLYISTKGNFDTNIFIKKFGDQFLIDRIRFDKDN